MAAITSWPVLFHRRDSVALRGESTTVAVATARSSLFTESIRT
jgi:hypothetical protein